MSATTGRDPAPTISTMTSISQRRVRRARRAPFALALGLGLGLAVSACGDDGSPHADALADYADASEAARARGRAVVDDLVAGRVSEVYERLAPELKATLSEAQASELLAELVATAPIGERSDERVVPLGPQRSIYVADHAWGSERLRVTVAEQPSGLGVALEPVAPLPPDPRLDAPASAALRLPFDGTWWAGEAPTPELGNHHLAAPEQRHAYDFLVWRDGATHRDDGDENAEYFAWDQPVLAPGAGTVVDVRDGIADNRPQVETNAGEPAGNHVVLEVGPGEYALLAHLRAGTVAVAEGDVVTAGEVIGRTGNSGNSSEPHLHFHVQDLPTFEPGTGTGIPVRFEQHLADGVEHDLGAPSGGQFVSAITD